LKQLTSAPLQPHLLVQWASSEGEVREAQRLRYRVFAQELGAQLEPQQGAANDAAGHPGNDAVNEPVDADRFDPFCDHLLVRAVGNCPHDAGTLVGTYRVLAPSAARHAGGLYIDTEFDIAALKRLRSKAVELGRSCVDPDWRSGAVIMTLWSALCTYMQERQLETMIGCTSIGLGDGGETAATLWQSLGQTHLVAPQWRVKPLHPWLGLRDISDATARAPAKTPPLLKGYLRCGARLLGPPALDKAFNTADLPMMLRIGDLAPRYRRRFAGP
jgi:putative hemolysin